MPRLAARLPAAIAAGIISGIVALMLGPAAASAQAQPPPDASQVQHGSRQFQQSCAFCHGPDATGGRGPDLIRSALVAHDVNGNLIGPVIHNGRPDKGMPALPLSDDQIKAVAAFLHERAQQALDSARLPKTYALAKLLTGNAAAGRAYFDGAGGCAACHSPTGDLKGIADKLPPLDLEAQMLYPEGRHGRSPVRATATVTVTMPSGEEVSGKLDHLDEFTVALIDSSGWYRSFARQDVKVEVHDPLSAHRALLGRITQDNFHNLFAYLETLK
ncbi:MAG TPA: c-type cytochrome [Terriglobia bacterium]|nr:c-type cytochrome [Terriglobia bacterium]